MREEDKSNSRDGWADTEDQHGDESPYLTGLPRQCKRCNTWARYDKPEKHNGCFTVTCVSCHHEFEVIIGMRGVRR